MVDCNITYYADRNFFRDAQREGYTHYSVFTGPWLMGHDKGVVCRIIGAVTYNPDGKISVSYFPEDLSHEGEQRKVTPGTRRKQYLTPMEWSDFQLLWRVGTNSRSRLSDLLENWQEQPSEPKVDCGQPKTKSAYHSALERHLGQR
jgi:hypothetical protein